MAIHRRPSFVLFLLILLITSSSAGAATVSEAPSPPPARPAAVAEEDASDDQVNRIIDALIGAGDFGSWAGVMSTAVLPLSATLFVPEDDAVSGPGDQFMLPYHVIPQRLTFPQLLQFRTHARLPTLLPGKTLVVTNSSQLNFTIDGSPVTMPDLYSTATFTVHGVGAAFDYSVYGDGLNVVPNPGADAGTEPDNESELFFSPHSDPISSAAPPCLCNELPVLFLAVCVALGLKIQCNNCRLKGII